MQYDCVLMTRRAGHRHTQRDNHVRTRGGDGPEERPQDRPHCIKKFYNLIKRTQLKNEQKAQNMSPKKIYGWHVSS